MSGEILQRPWHHVTILNDSRADTAIMYLDGVPVLGNASGVGGMMVADFMPWVVGASTRNAEPDHGRFGCVGETRLVDHALRSSEFLYPRADLAGAFCAAGDSVLCRRQMPRCRRSTYPGISGLR
ncbi:hypothetical protein [Microbacterium sp. NPDC087665]|uniref:hypothetical protein n=1 Tax=Microbacterium sp. NPDC087665 TaxID=3364194 RepID=UPI00381DE120